jgi:hypothetical protein
MKNNTKIRLHLTKQLFESLTKQVIAEAKMKHNLGAGMTELKAKKEKKAKVEEMETRVAEAPKKHDIKELTTGEYDFAQIGYWAAETFGIPLGKGEYDAVQLGGNVLAVATGGAIGVLTGLVMYADNIKSGVKKAADKLKSFVKGKEKGISEGDDKLAQAVEELPDEVIAALKK